MKKKIKTLLFLTSSSLVASSFISLVACSKPEPEKKGVQIYEPSSKYTRTFVNEESYFRICFYGFQYDYDSSIIFDKSKLEVHSTFTCPAEWGRLDEDPVLHINEDNKTFNISIQGWVNTDQQEEITISGKFSFNYDGQPIEDFKSSTFSTDVVFDTKINIPAGGKYSSTHLDGDGNGEVVFTGFKYIGSLSHPENFKVSNTFSQTSIGTSFESSIINFDEDEQEFDVRIQINGALPVRALTGTLSFSYFDGEIPLVGDNTFEMDLFDVISITQPTDDDKIYDEQFIDKQGKISFLFKGFQFTGIEDQDEITVKNEDFEKTCTAHGWSAPVLSIVNWDTKAKSFAVKVDIDLGSSPSLAEGDQLTGSFEFKVGDAVTSTSEKPFKAQIKYAIPLSYLDISESEGSMVLKGLISQEIHSYNTLLIPNNVTKIEAEAFKNEFVSGGNNSNIKFLSFASACPVENIGVSAFEGCTSLYINNLTLPSRLTRINQAAFKGCAGLSGCLSLPLSSPTNEIIVNSEAFANCKGFNKIVVSKVVNIGGVNSVFSGCVNCSVLDFSDLSKDKLPSWLASYSTQKHYFKNLGKSVCSTTNKGKVLLPSGTSDTLKASWIEKLKSIGDLNIGDENAIWECVIV